MVKAVDIVEYLSFAKKHAIIDVRTPAEFEQGHIPGAVNVPLFTNEERAIVGTLYKQTSREEAILKGLEFVGPKMADLTRNILKHAQDKTILIHCWRGGMRSGSVAWLVSTYGLNAYTLKGGYKAFRKLMLEQFNKNKNIKILGGKTGSGKTEILHLLEKKDQAIIDLEALAHHKGSSFGSINEQQQPTQEQFENDLGIKLMDIPFDKTIWIEDESRIIGKRVIPEGLWLQMRESTTYYIDLPTNIRAEYLTTLYGKYDHEQLKLAVKRLEKRLGGLATKQALEAIDTNELKTACELILIYYDKTYSFGLTKREKPKIVTLSFQEQNVEHIIQTLLSAIGNN